MLNKEDKRNVHINTDIFNKQLKPFLQKTFPGEDLFLLALKQEDRLKEVIKQPWLDLLKQTLLNVKENINVFVEIPYGLQIDKMMFRFIGGKIIYIGCEDNNQNKIRVIQRNTPEVFSFINKIPGLKETQEIVKKHHLSLRIIKSSGSLGDLSKQAINFNDSLNKEF